MYISEIIHILVKKSDIYRFEDIYFWRRSDIWQKAATRQNAAISSEKKESRNKLC